MRSACVDGGPGPGHLGGPARRPHGLAAGDERSDQRRGGAGRDQGQDQEQEVQ